MRPRLLVVKGERGKKVEDFSCTGVASKKPSGTFLELYRTRWGCTRYDNKNTGIHFHTLQKSLPLIGTRVCNQAAQLSGPLFMNNYKQESRKHAPTTFSFRAPLSLLFMLALSGIAEGFTCLWRDWQPRATVWNQVTPPFWILTLRASTVPSGNLKYFYFIEPRRVEWILFLMYNDI